MAVQVQVDKDLIQLQGRLDDARRPYVLHLLCVKYSTLSPAGAMPDGHDDLDPNLSMFTPSQLDVEELLYHRESTANVYVRSFLECEADKRKLDLQDASTQVTIAIWTFGFFALTYTLVPTSFSAKDLASTFLLVWAMIGMLAAAVTVYSGTVSFNMFACKTGGMVCQHAVVIYMLDALWTSSYVSYEARVVIATSTGLAVAVIQVSRFKHMRDTGI